MYKDFIGMTIKSTNYKGGNSYTEAKIFASY